MADNGKIIVNGEICCATDHEAILNSQEAYAYEVIRVIDGKPLFLDDHLERLRATLRGIGISCEFTAEELREDFARLCEVNDVTCDNVKMIIQCDTVCMMITGASYPDAELYENGVTVGVLSAVRENPQAKISNYGLRESANRMIAENGFFEVMLADNEDCITEGSRSNIFFIRGDEVVTSPAEGVLLGITRKRIMSVCVENGIPVLDEKIRRDALGTFDAAFVSGTSPKVLPISTVSDGQKITNFDVNNPLLRRVMALYDEEIAAYLEK